MILRASGGGEGRAEVTGETPAGSRPATAPEHPDEARATDAALRATYVAFIATGVAFSSWASRIPQVRDRLQLTPSELGLVLLAIAAGSVVALPLSGMVIARVGSRRTVATLAAVDGVALAVVALGYLSGVVPVVVGLLAFGLAQGGWDVAMNVQGAGVERRLGRSVMPRFHAGFSVGTVAGALTGAVMVALRVPVTVHLLGVGILVGVGVPLAVRAFLPDADGPGAGGGAGARRALAAWREPRTLGIGLFVLAFAFAEGTGNDWTGVALIDGYGTSPVLGTLGFATFLAAMTAGRWFGPALIDRYGRARTVRILAVAGIVGVVGFAAGGPTPVAFAGVALWGLGLSLGFPVGMSAGADQPELAAQRVSVISSIGYFAFLAGPPLIGFLGERLTVLHALAPVAALLGFAAVLADVVRPLPPDDHPG